MKIIGDNIISSLGFTTAENFEAVKKGISGLKLYHLWNLPEPFMASLIDKEHLQDAFSQIRSLGGTYTLLEQAMILSVLNANETANIDLASSKVLFIVSTTKGNVHLLDENQKNQFDKKHIYLWYLADIVARFFHNENTPIVVSNSCISGGCAQIVAQRYLQTGQYDYAVVLGADMLSRFIVSGFQVFKALSNDLCKPFDAAHCGLNLGESAGTIIYSNTSNPVSKDSVSLVEGFICNDATHISAPSRTADGSFIAMNQLITKYQLGADQLGFINAHGTATKYNDEMEATAISRCGLTQTPVNSLKGYFGHTLGAAGVLESIITAHALKNQIALRSKGFETSMPDFSLNVLMQNKSCQQPFALKMLSGFGGTNAVLLFEKGNTLQREHTHKPVHLNEKLFIDNSCKISGNLKEWYRKLKLDYPKFFKMDNFTKAGFLASEILLQNELDKQHTAIICFTASSSINTDTAYQKVIQKEDAFFPSPSLFVYTLPNIVAGEIAIRRGLTTETSCYLSENIDAKMIKEMVSHVFNCNPTLQQVLTGWINDDEFCEAKLMLIKKEGQQPFTVENIESILITKF